MNIYEGKNARLKESISMDVEKDDKGNFLKYKNDRAAKFAMILAETGAVNVYDNDPFFDPLIISASIDNRQNVADATGKSRFVSYKDQKYAGCQSKPARSYKDFKYGNAKRYNGNIYYQNLSFATVYNAMDKPVLKLETNYSMKEAKYILYYSHIGGAAQPAPAFNISYPKDKSDRFVSVQGDAEFKTILDR